tara:strand:+ start:182 stop:436 length:255 start_codon:yes stop_codon:yes gene_type:complete
MNKKETNQIPPDIRILSFEKALEELEDIINSLESGDISLEKSIAAYTKANNLRIHCSNKLKEAKLKIEKITLDNKGELKAKNKS